MAPFEVKDCALLVRTSGLPPAMSMRELRERIAVCGEGVLYHHFCETTLRPTFDDPDYRNDFAVWIKRYLGDRVLAERLGILDPYAASGMDEMRTVTLDIIDDRLGELPYVPWVRHGDEFLFMEATTVVFDTGDFIHAPLDLAPAILRMTNGSIYYHFLEALRRPPVGKDDFSAWLSEAGKEFEPYLKALASIDFQFHNLAHLRKELARVLLQVKEGI
ncbi:MAG: hypothetical protein HY896_10045 [Deltaproteobacteria bacterium]|nr:hypothetical protein [Deltaproteobacteria bacterium]